MTYISWSSDFYLLFCALKNILVLLAKPDSGELCCPATALIYMYGSHIGLSPIVWYCCLDKGLVEDAGTDLGSFSTAFFEHTCTKDIWTWSLMGIETVQKLSDPIGVYWYILYISSIPEYKLGPFEGMSPAFSRVYTDPNCLLYVSALSLFPGF